MVAKRREGRPLRHRCRIVERAHTNNQVDGWGWAPSVVVDDRDFFFTFLFVILFFFSFFLLLMWRRAPSTSRRQLVPDAVDISKRPSVRPSFFFYFFFFFLSPLGSSWKHRARAHPLYCSVYTVHNYYLCPSLAVFLCLLLLSSLGCIYAVAKTHHSLNYSIWTRDFSPVFFGGFLFSPAFHSGLCTDVSPLFFCLAFSSLFGNLHTFFLDFSTKWKNKFFLFWNSKIKVCPGLRSIDSNYNQMKGKRKFFWITKYKKRRR